MDEQERSLAPQQPDEADQDTDLELTGAPEEFGFPANPTAAQAQSWANQERFLHALGETGSVGAAAAAAGIHVQTVYNWDTVDTYNYKKRKQAALERFMGKVEAEINRRAIEGYQEQLHHKGVLTGDVVTKYSDNLLMFRAKKLDPSYKDNYQPPPPNTHVAITQTVITVNDYRRDAQGEVEVVGSESWEFKDGKRVRVDERSDGRDSPESGPGAVVEGQSRELTEDDKTGSGL
jgi:hypothetical protein